MPSVIQELAEEGVTLDVAHVIQRVEEWQMRLSALYDSAVAWLPEYANDRRETVEMDEPLMREYGVDPVRVPVLTMSDAQGDVARFVPRGLWIIGANGRVDLFSQRGQFLIVDRSDYFSLARWEIAPALQRLKIAALSSDTLRQSIR